jgi:hypothetical protein
MAEPQSSNQLVKAGTSGSEGYSIQLSRPSAAGKMSEMVVHIPAGMSVDALRENPMLLAAALKDGDPTWAPYDFGFVFVAVLHAASLGLDIIQGDVYPVDGRIGVSDWAKIKYARNTGKYRHEVDMGELPPCKVAGRKGELLYDGPNYECTVRIYSNDLLETTYTTQLKNWVGKSTEWVQRPAESLRRKALARAYQEICPVGTEPSEVPTQEVSNAPRLQGARVQAASAVQTEGEGQG